MSASWITKAYNSELEAWGFTENSSLKNYKEFPTAEEFIVSFDIVNNNKAKALETMTQVEKGGLTVI